MICSFPESESLFCSFVKSNDSKSLPSLFKKEQRSKEWREWFALGHKKGKRSEKLKKTWWKLQIFSSELLVFWERKSESGANQSQRAKSKRANSQPCVTDIIILQYWRFTPYHGCCYNHSSLLCLLCCFVKVFYYEIIITVYASTLLMSLILYNVHIWIKINRRVGDFYIKNIKWYEH